jgi:hypothetical protein
LLKNNWKNWKSLDCVQNVAIVLVMFSYGEGGQTYQWNSEDKTWDAAWERNGLADPKYEVMRS